MNTRHIASLFLAAFIAIAGACSPETTVKPDEGNGTEQLKKAENLAKVRIREEARIPAKARQKRP